MAEYYSPYRLSQWRLLQKVFDFVARLGELVCAIDEGLKLPYTILMIKKYTSTGESLV